MRKSRNISLMQGTQQLCYCCLQITFSYWQDMFSFYSLTFTNI